MNQPFALPHAYWPYLEALLRLALALALGLLVGLERERRGKEAGLRTFGFIALLGGMAGSLGSEGFAIVTITLVGLLAVPLNIQTLRSGNGTELTTSAAMLVTCMAGILCGQGHTVTPAAVMVGTTALLAWKDRLAGLSMELTEGELRSALLLAILALVIYPALPVGPVGPWQLIEPRAAWVTVILIASIGFVNYILWKMYGARGTVLSGFFGGLVNSNFTVIEMLSRVKESKGQFASSAYRGILVATAAMVVRNATLLLVLAPFALLSAAAAFALMIATSAALVLNSHLHRTQADAGEPGMSALKLPFSLPLALRYGALFLVLHVVGQVMQREFGEAGFYVVTAVGGLLSSASAVAAAASMASQGAINARIAGTGAIIASLTSIAFSLSFVIRTRDRGLARGVVIAALCIAAAGIVGIVAGDAVSDLIWRRIPLGVVGS
jgi:uncharacterized membrane protein (DUF4010 family)